MGMRVKVIIAVFGIVFVSSVTTWAQSLKPGLVAMGTVERWSERPYSPLPKVDETQVAFCGQCSADEHCGSGHKCCGPSTCRQCYAVVTCPRR